MFISISNHVIIVPHLLSVAKRDAWISVILAYFFFVIWGVFIFLITRKMGDRNLYDWVKLKSGRISASFISTFFICYLFISAVISFVDLIQAVNIYFLPDTPKYLVSIVYLILVVRAGGSGTKPVIHMAAILLPIVCALGFLVATATMNAKTYSYLLPILSNGNMPVIKGTFIVLGGCTDILILTLLQDKLKKKFSFLQLFSLMSIIIWLTLGPTIGSITAFGPFVAANLRFPAFEQWRLISFGYHLTHVDFLAVFQLLAGVTIKVAFCIALIKDHYESHIKKWSKELGILLVTLFILVPFSHISDIKFASLVQDYLFYVPIVGILVTLYLFLLCSYQRRNERKDKEYE